MRYPKQGDLYRIESKYNGFTHLIVNTIIKLSNKNVKIDVRKLDIPSIIKFHNNQFNDQERYNDYEIIDMDKFMKKVYSNNFVLENRKRIETKIMLLNIDAYEEIFK